MIPSRDDIVASPIRDDAPLDGATSGYYSGHTPQQGVTPGRRPLTLALVSVQLPVAVHLTSSCTQRSPQLWAFSDTGAVNSTKGDSEDSGSTPTCLNCGL